MTMFLVLADDITGAAEIAGIAKKHGRRTILCFNRVPERLDDADVAVVATDIRSGDRDCAQAETERVCRGILDMPEEYRNGLRIFKKTDSVLRGHVCTELSVIMRRLGFRRSLLIAQNPSKGRIIRNGGYFVNGAPLNETMFAKDPEFPATTSLATELVGKDICKPLPLDERMDRDLNGVIFVADAADKEELHRQAMKTGDETLTAGGADFFEELLDCDTRFGCRSMNNDTCSLNKTSAKYLVICGSTQTKSIAATPLMSKKRAVEASIPHDVFEGANPDEWISGLCNAYAQAEAFILRVGDHELKGAEYARRIRTVMAKAAERMIKTSAPDCLIIEGGATAFSVLAKLDWTEFNVSHEYSPGVVGMVHGNTEVILKPGSYPWGDLFSL